VGGDDGLLEVVENGLDYQFYFAGTPLLNGLPPELLYLELGGVVLGAVAVQEVRIVPTEQSREFVVLLGLSPEGLLVLLDLAGLQAELLFEGVDFEHCGLDGLHEVSDFVVEGSELLPGVKFGVLVLEGVLLLLLEFRVLLVDGLEHLLGEDSPLGDLLLDLLPDLHLSLQILELPLHLDVAVDDVLGVEGLVLQFLEELVVLEEGQAGVVVQLVPADRQQVALHAADLVHHF